MIRKLRFKLVSASMFSLFAVLLIIMSIISVLNYQNVVSDADGTLAILAENGGSFPSEDKSADETSKTPSGRGKREISPELPYESRYFSVTFQGDGNVLSANTEKIAAIDADTAVEYAQTAWQSGKTCGFLNDYRFLVSASGTETQVIFLDCGRNLSTFRTFVLSSAVVCVFGLLSVFLLLVVLSGRITRPFVENYEKQKRFITDAGHELKTPLTIIDADAEILEMDFGPSEWLEDIQSQVTRLTELTNDLIFLSRMEEGAPQTQMIPFPLSDMVEETLLSFQTLAVTQGKTLTGQIQPMLSLCGDEKALRQLVTILLDNAVKYAQPGGSIALTLEKQRNTLRLSVWNTTSHISGAQLEYLFDRFYRTDQSRNSQTGGHGLGLSIAAAIVNTHRGKITASTTDERSLQITVTLPAGRSE